MTPRDKELLPRLLDNLDTLENPGEISATIRQLRRMFPKGLRGLLEAGGGITLAGSDEQLNMVLRAVGMLVPHLDIPGQVELLGRAGAALRKGGSLDHHAVLVLIAGLGGLLNIERDRVREMGEHIRGRVNEKRENSPFSTMAEATRSSLDTMRQAMDASRREERREERSHYRVNTVPRDQPRAVNDAIREVHGQGGQPHAPSFRQEKAS